MMIKDPRYFFGRKEELDMVFDKLNGVHPQSSNVISNGRIGASSFLYRIKTLAPEKLTRPNAFAPVYLDLQGSEFETPASFRRMVLSELGCRGFDAAKPIEATQFETEISKLNGKGITPVLLLDKFESLLKPQRMFDANFFLMACAHSPTKTPLCTSSSHKNRLETVLNR